MRNKIIAIMVLLYSSSVFAEDVVVFDRPPTKDEILSIFFPKPSVEIPESDVIGGRSRMVDFTKKNQPTKKAGEPVLGKVGEPVLGIRLQFDLNSYTVANGSDEYLRSLGAVLQENESIRLVIEGHTDGIGSKFYNMDLSKKRALEVREYLANAYGIAPRRLIAKGYGQSRPLEGLPISSDLNRRVQFRLLH